MYHQGVGPLEQLAGGFARLCLRLDCFCSGETFSRSLERSVEARKLMTLRGESGVNLCKPLTRLGVVAGERRKRDAGLLVGKFGAALHARCAPALQFCNNALSFFNVGKHDFISLLYAPSP